MWGCETRWVARRHPGHWQSSSSWRLCRDWCMGSKGREQAGGKAVIRASHWGMGIAGALVVSWPWTEEGGGEQAAS